MLAFLLICFQARPKRLGPKDVGPKRQAVLPLCRISINVGSQPWCIVEHPPHLRPSESVV